MSESTSVPVSITPEAAARVAHLGMQAELQEMIDHTREAVPGLLRIHVISEDRYETGDEPAITIEAVLEGPVDPEDRTLHTWADWEVSRFPPQVCEHFTLMLFPGPSHAG